LKKKFKDLTPRESFLAMNCLLSIKSPIYLIDDIANVKAPENLFELKDSIEKLTKTGSSVIYLHSFRLKGGLDSILAANKSFTLVNEWEHQVEMIRIEMKNMPQKPDDR